MSQFDPIIAQTEQKYGLPPGILAATASVESSDNPNAVSPQGAVGLMQILPSTAHGLGVDPRDPAQAIDGAGRLWAQNLKASGGDIDRAAMMYHGGPDTRQWGPKTHAYPQKLAEALGPAQAQEGGDPIEAALSGQPSAQPQSEPPPQAAPVDPNDPIESALAGNAPQAPASSDANAVMKQMYEKGAKTADIVAYGQQHGLTPNADQIEQARKQGFGTVNFQYHDQDNPAQPQDGQTNQALGFLEGVTKPIDNAATWLKQGADKLGISGPVDALGSALGLPSLNQANTNQQTYFKGQEAQGQTPGKLGEFAGEVAGTLPVAAATGNPWLAGGLSGALTTDDPNNLKQTAIDAAIGAVGGKVTHALTGAVAGAIAPKVSAAVQKLNALGVPMTPGQIMGGALKRMEDGATSVPGYGDVIKTAQRRSSIGLNNSVLNDRVMSPIGESLPNGLVGRDAVNFADKTVSGKYNELIPKLNVQADKTFYDGVENAMGGTADLPAAKAEQVQNIIKNNVVDRFKPDWSMDGDTFKTVDEKLGDLRKDYSGSDDPDQRTMGTIFGDVQGELRDMLARSNPQHAEELGNINKAFANLVRIEGAAGSLGAKGGIWTPSQLAGAVKRYDSSSRRKGFATGNALLQDVSDAADSVLPSSVPDSGSAFRAIAAYLLGGGLSHINPAVAPALAPLALYSRVGQKAFQKAALAPRGPATQALAKALTKMKTPLAIAGGGAAAQTADGR